MRRRHWRALTFGVGVAVLMIPSNASAETLSVTSQGVHYTCGPRPNNLEPAPPTPAPNNPGGTVSSAPTQSSSALPTICPSGYLPIIPKTSASKPGALLPSGLIRQQISEGTFTTQAATEEANQAISEDEAKAAIRAAGSQAALEGNLPPKDPTGEEISGGVYWHDIETRSWPSSEDDISLWTEESQESPVVDTTETGGHSLGQLWAVNDETGVGKYSDIETGWIKWADCPHTNFFVYHVNGGQGSTYNGEFVQYSNKQVPSTGCGNGTVEGTDDTWHEYWIYYYAAEENWWVHHDGEWIGYFPKSAFSSHWITDLNVGEAGGEVGEPLWDYYPYTQMGNAQPGDSDYAAMFWEVARELANGKSYYTTLAEPYETEACRYSLGHFHERGTGDFRYGGPGWTVGGSCPTGQ